MNCCVDDMSDKNVIIAENIVLTKVIAKSDWLEKKLGKLEQFAFVVTNLPDTALNSETVNQLLETCGITLYERYDETQAKG